MAGASGDGRDLMKECAWSVSPAGGFMVRRSDNPDQQFLIKPEPVVTRIFTSWNQMASWLSQLQGLQGAA